METFIFYVEELFVKKNETITIPKCYTGNLEELENYYQNINIYYSFCKIFKLNFDVQWIYDERIRISDAINEILLQI